MTFCLHYVFLPRINSSLKSFQLAWNHHLLSTEQNHSPMQLYTQGAIDLQFYGIDHEEPLQEYETDEVTVPATTIPLSQRSLEYLINTVNPLQECSDNGIQLYVSTVSVLYSLMQRDNLIIHSEKMLRGTVSKRIGHAQLCIPSFVNSKNCPIQWNLCIKDTLGT